MTHLKLWCSQKFHQQNLLKDFLTYLLFNKFCDVPESYTKEDMSNKMAK